MGHAAEVEQALPAGQETMTPPPRELILTGIVHLPPNRKRAYLLLAPPAQDARPYDLMEGEQRGELEMLSIDPWAGSVRVRHRGNVVQLSFDDQWRSNEAARQAERQKDASHAAHHALRARLERERDERDRSEALRQGLSGTVRQPVREN
jgi:hypothetical protein